MNQTTRSILNRILSVIEEYETNKHTLRTTVDALEGSISALGEKLSPDFYDAWYNHWGNLETILALGIENQRQEKILSELDLIENLVRKELSK